LVQNPAGNASKAGIGQIPTRSGLPLALYELGLARRALAGERDAARELDRVEKNRFDVYA